LIACFLKKKNLDSPMSLAKIIEKIGRECNQSDKSIARVIQLLSNNWIDTLDQWKALDPQLRERIELPLFLAQALDNMSEHEVHREGAEPKLPSYIDATDSVDLHFACIGRNDDDDENDENVFVIVDAHRFALSLRRSLADLFATLDLHFREKYNVDEPLHFGLFVQLPPPGQTEYDTLVAAPSAFAQLPGTHNSNSNVIASSSSSTTTAASSFSSSLTTNLPFYYVSPNCSVSNALREDRELVMWGAVSRRWLLKRSALLVAVDQWMVDTVGLPAHSAQLIATHGIDDFFALPFVQRQVVEQVVGEQLVDDCARLNDALDRLRSMRNDELVAEWVAHIGFREHRDAFVRHCIDLEHLALISRRRLASICDIEQVTTLFALVKQYRNFSSVEASYKWLVDCGHRVYALEFIRYNIPFYSLPLINFFIISEMGAVGVPRDYDALLRHFAALPRTPAYAAKAIAYWLRDLNLEHYGGAVGRRVVAGGAANFVECLPLLTVDAIDADIDDRVHRDKARRAVADMREFHFYYSIAAALLDNDAVRRHAALLYERRVAIDTLPFLSDKQLIAIGIADATERRQFIEALAPIRNRKTQKQNSSRSRSGSESGGSSLEGAAAAAAAAAAVASANVSTAGGSLRSLFVDNRSTQRHGALESLLNDL
jgi:SAM domain (Sterile alpha motif)